MLWDRCIGLGIEVRKKLRGFVQHYETGDKRRGTTVRLIPSCRTDLRHGVPAMPAISLGSDGKTCRPMS